MQLATSTLTPTDRPELSPIQWEGPGPELRLILPGGEPMPSQTAPPPSSVDARGRAIPRTPEERRRRAEEAIRALDALDGIGSEEEQRRTFVQLRQGLDAGTVWERRRFRG